MTETRRQGYTTIDVPVRGGLLHAAIWGADNPSAPTILAVHGVTSSHMQWAVLADALPGVRIIAPDLRGRGRSNALPGPFGMAAHAEDLAALLDAASAGPVVVLGHSMGAFAALVLAHAHPHLVSSLVLVDGGLPLPLPPGVSVDDAIGAILGPAAARLSMSFPDVDTYLGFWRRHPAFAGNWNGAVEAYARYDLEGEAPTLHPSTAIEAMTEDSRDLLAGNSVVRALHELNHPAVLLWAPRGLLNESPGLYTRETVDAWSRGQASRRAELVPDVNHYTIVMGSAGAARVATAVSGALDTAHT
ncbi:alpha/beta fold hydrolase [Arthrobacter oryzae]|uniref:Pimeloyl-ACP methyl ester carboxylesterase n=1 Tax=Arthrobacter oryzae TaxID=409290 RepID=A0A495FLY5_9MICC|nr:alpha/beta hydrolase [Arthrobacter oryzae]RKR30258.1 pimeloyl-ACP methyl ester carboxylesterase [Arthrobacter oryzae]